MLEERNVKLDLFALALLALVIFAGLSLVSYHRADPLGLDDASSLVYPASKSVDNICGRGGAWVADRLLRGLGVGAYCLVLTLAGLDVLLLMRRPIPQPVLRVFGWIVSLAGLTTLASMAVPSVWPTLWNGPEIGPGGYLGAAGRGLLEMNFAAAGAYILTLSLIAGGLLLSTDYLFVRLFAWCVHKPVTVAVRAGRAVTAGRKVRAGEEVSAAKEGTKPATGADDGSDLSVRKPPPRMKTKKKLTKTNRPKIPTRNRRKKGTKLPTEKNWPTMPLPPSRA
ncbi:MAG: DNA translocase FtsK 4TM domain-containing protein [Planctomycetia bacterium]|nr:DNA translocase FtsK 4TM domain-containing protein [Planctomycetia bacterium]